MAEKSSGKGKRKPNPAFMKPLQPDATLAAIKAIEKAGSYDGTAIRAALTKLSFEGASGPLSFDSRGDRASGAFELWKVVKDASTETGYKNVQIKLVTLD